MAQRSIAESPQATVLVLGAGGNVSQGIIKALAFCRPRPRVVAACVDPYAAGLYAADIALISPYATDVAFLPWLMDTCEEQGIDGVMSGVEAVLTVLSSHAAEIERQTGSRCVVSPPAALEVGHDKLETVRWLAQRGLPHPDSAPADDHDDLDRLVSACGFPLIAKPRVGKGSAGVAAVASADALRPFRGRADYILQQRLEGDEFTAATFSDRDGGLRGTACMRRSLAFGTTVHAEVGGFPAVRAAAGEIAATLRPVGPANMQMRLHEGRPVCFEINVRFSGTAPIRAHFGFNDVEAALLHLVQGEPPRDLPDATPGHAIRYWSEVYVEPAGIGMLLGGRTLDPPLALAEFGRLGPER